MIIELFGPPGAGKTTFAYALAAQLRKRGHVVDLFVSYRPIERLPGPDPCVAAPARRLTAATIRRLTRPVVELLTLVRHPLANLRDIGTAANLIRILPPKNVIWSIKMGQYISRFSHSWYEASAANHIVLFDQAYVQAICSLAILSDIEDETVLTHALDVVPNSDLLIQLSAPSDILKTRLNERCSHQGPIERLFEFDLSRNLKSIEIIDRLHDLLWRKGRPVTCACSLDPQSLREGSENVAQQLLERSSNQYVGAA
jgi:RecA/RadA recombinase